MFPAARLPDGSPPARGAFLDKVRSPSQRSFLYTALSTEDAACLAQTQRGRQMPPDCPPWLWGSNRSQTSKLEWGGDAPHLPRDPPPRPILCLRCCRPGAALVPPSFLCPSGVRCGGPLGTDGRDLGSRAEMQLAPEQPQVWASPLGASFPGPVARIPTSSWKGTHRHVP